MDNAFSSLTNIQSTNDKLYIGNLIKFDNPIFNICQTKNTNVKRYEDIILGSIILMIILIPMLFVALAIKLTSKGPILFTQTRRGVGGKEFKIYKFRTMKYEDSAKALDGKNVLQVTKNDSRVTKLGSFLRKTSLDELPQFLNVIQGDMSIVGPRPHAIVHDELYGKLIEAYNLRQLVKPGITGWAQVNGWRGETNTLHKMVKRVEYDVVYISRWSLLMDLKIILLTFSKKAHQCAY